MVNDPNQLDDFFGLQPEHQDAKQESLKETINKKLSFQSRLRLLPKVLSSRERYIILTLVLVAFFSILALPVTSFYHLTEPVPDHGGTITEGILGEPRLINPLLAQGSDADRDLTSLIFSGLMKYNAEGKLVPDLAKSAPEISSDGLSYTIYVKENVLWHDGEKLTADDVIFTIQTAQNPDYVSPQRISWQGVDIEKVNDYTVRFKLKNKYAQFQNNLTIGILPKHLWQYVKPINFSLSELNAKPIGSGPYTFSKLKKNKLGAIDSYELRAHTSYYDGEPYITTLIAKFYTSEEEMLAAFERNDIQNISFVSGKKFSDVKSEKRLQLHELKLPRYFALFSNQNQSKVLSDKNVRIALNHATDRGAIISTILQGKGMAITSPMISGILDINAAAQDYEFDQDKAKDILKTSGWTTLDAGGILTKKDQRLTIKLTTSTWPELVEVAQKLKEQYQQVGIEITVEALPISQLQQVIKDRDYQMLLFGEILNIDPDPFSLWHSSQKRDPGLNLALYDNKTADGLLELARQTVNPLERRQKYDDFQKVVLTDAPAVFLYSPYYLYGTSKNIRNIAASLISTPSDRFANVEQWYIETRRKLKRN